jgi:polysaccharide export outer membrane protein
MVNSEGVITVPFAGQVPAAGRSLQAIEAEIVKRLQGMAHQPQVLVRLTHNATANVTVVGEVAANTRMPLTPRGERLLDALAAAGGVKQTVSKVTLQVTRGANVYALPLDMIIRDPQQNIVLKPGDVITALYQPLSFTMLGAGGKNEEINFEAQGISLTQALARAGGLQDNRADARGVFIFRLEPIDSLDWPVRPNLITPDGKVPVIYRADLSDPATFFAAQAFPVKDKDMVYVSNAPAVGFQKFLNLIVSVTYPTLTLMNSLQQ